ncbi:CBS domain-containing protein [Vibrio sp. SS-MA-C1-2]|uniref:CBS domain-containing protein n=1 Tax=Vibrio sp. SS-MA-C1-2 TaxID=2908646 RepID=UPI001F33A2A7|nr:CBS domain-containing protein [Vibrio sp. SS-MA-C1-2]UJF18981.1 CBS domain-containing protein [Vibrio sp. SS-MA-C1-2]
MFTVEDMMTPHPHTLTLERPISDAKQLMAKSGIRHIPIINKKKELIGLVTQRNILAAQESSLQQSVNPEQDLMITMADIMLEKVATVTPKAGLKEAALYMQKHKYGCLPVVEGKQIIGIITDTDFVGIAINLLELQEESEPLAYDE